MSNQKEAQAADERLAWLRENPDAPLTLLRLELNLMVQLLRTDDEANRPRIEAAIRALKGEQNADA